MTTVAPTLSRAQHLKSATAAVHDNVDKTIMAKDPFANSQNYLEFLRLQYYFLKDVSALYEHPALLELISDLTARRRLSLLEQDFVDLSSAVPSPFLVPVVTHTTELATALGWLYVVEGSKVGAAMLGKQVQTKLNYHAEHAARYLTGPGAGRGSAWRELIQIIDSIDFNEEQEQALFEGACQAFTRFQTLQAHVYS